ncbi:DUF349 domain-containing protein [Nocardioides sp. W3-2-3]|nr:DUF349 domain-containing protein [Nocardioides convexus]
MPDASPEEALAFYTKRYDNLALEVDLLHKRVLTGVLSPEEALSSVRLVREQARRRERRGRPARPEPQGSTRLGPVIASQRDARRAAKAQRVADARGAKEKLADEAEKIAGGRDWRNGANRLREPAGAVEAGCPASTRPPTTSLWKRFSSARSAYTKARKAHFAEQDERRDGARVIKERLVKEAEALAGSTDWGPTSGRYRDLMRDWKAAGPAPKAVDDALWQRFRGAQDTFFGARDAANAALDSEFAANAEVKEGLLVEAEAILAPLAETGDLAAAKAAFREVAEKWDAAGKVPRDRIKDLEGRMRAVEQTIRKAEDEQWRKSDPEKSARADDMVSKPGGRDRRGRGQGSRQPAPAGTPRRSASLEENLEGRRSFLEMARRASAEFRLRVVGIPASAGIPTVLDRCNGQEPQENVKNPEPYAGLRRMRSALTTPRNLRIRCSRILGSARSDHMIRKHRQPVISCTTLSRRFSRITASACRLALAKVPLVLRSTVKLEPAAEVRQGEVEASDLLAAVAHSILRLRPWEAVPVEEVERSALSDRLDPCVGEAEHHRRRERVGPVLDRALVPGTEILDRESSCVQEVVRGHQCHFARPQERHFQSGATRRHHRVAVDVDDVAREKDPRVPADAGLTPTREVCRFG